MVSLAAVLASNARASKTLPPGLVAVFAGATAGIGELALKAFAKHAPQPRIYFIGRSEEAGRRIKEELKVLNAQGEYVFIKAELSLLKNVDDVCARIKEREAAINVLFMTQGTVRRTGKSSNYISIREETTEGLPYLVAVTYYSRLRLASNLLPLIRAAPSLRRVITTLSGTFEGHLYVDDLTGRKIPLSAGRGHLTSLMTLALEPLAKKAPEVSFVHNFPGAVNTNVVRKDDGLLLKAARFAVRFWPLDYMDKAECGERHAYLCLGERFPPAMTGGRAVDGVDAVKGTDGTVGSGVYSIDGLGEAASDKVVELLRQYRSEGVVEKIWEHTEGEFTRITGVASI